MVGKMAGGSPDANILSFERRLQPTRSEWAHNSFVHPTDEHTVKARQVRANGRTPLQPRQSVSSSVNKERGSGSRGSRESSTITLQKLMALSHEGGRMSAPSETSSSGAFSYLSLAFMPFCPSKVQRVRSLDDAPVMCLTIKPTQRRCHHRVLRPPLGHPPRVRLPIAVVSIRGVSRRKMFCATCCATRGGTSSA